MVGTCGLELQTPTVSTSRLHGFFFNPVVLIQPHGVFYIFPDFSKYLLIQARLPRLLEPGKHLFDALVRDRNSTDRIIHHFIAGLLQLLDRQNGPSHLRAISRAAV